MNKQIALISSKSLMLNNLNHLRIWSWIFRGKWLHFICCIIMGRYVCSCAREKRREAEFHSVPANEKSWDCRRPRKYLASVLSTWWGNVKQGQIAVLCDHCAIYPTEPWKWNEIIKSKVSIYWRAPKGLLENMPNSIHLQVP